jgi:hypothetical protein
LFVAAFDVTRLDEGVLTMVPADDLGLSVEAPYLAAHGSNGCGPAFGGLAADGGASARVLVDGAPGGSLEVARIGAAAGRVGAGPLRGAWVVVGGAAPDPTGGQVAPGPGVSGTVALRPVPGAEVWLP